MQNVTLTPYQRKQLQTAVRETQDAALCRRAMALLELGAGKPLAEVARLLSRQPAEPRQRGR